MRGLVLLVTLHWLYVCVRCGEREKRELSMLRMGKRGVEVLPGRAISLPPLVPPNYDVGEEFDEREILLPNGEARQVWVPRVGKDVDYEDRYMRAPPFPRLGKVYDDYMNDIRRDIADEILLKYPHHFRTRRSVGVASAHKSEQKRAALPRLGLRGEFEERAAPLPRLGLIDRAAPLPRLGLREEQQRSFPRLGLREYDDYYLDDIERAAPLPRLGVREEERAMPLPRMGVVEKRAMGMLRMGKRAMGMLRMGKRPVSMLRMGRSQETNNEEEKRAMSMLRMGKRAMGMLRMGRSDNSETEEESRAIKRAMGMLRMGRSDIKEDDKRAMGMLRMGKRPMSMLRMGRSDSDSAPPEEKRAMGMLRMGKRPVSMLRMGKRDTESIDEDHREEAH